MAQTVEHIATVIRADDDVVEAELTVQSACAVCHARSVCGLGESKRKRVEIATPDAAAYVPGESVVVSIESNMGMTAVFWAYVMPFVVLLGALIVSSAAGAGDGVSALAALAATALYFVALYLCRARLERKIHFKIHKP